MIPLPIDPLLSDVVASLRRNPSLVLEAPPGAGKTTRVPRAMLDAGMAVHGEIVVLQPRRIAARLAARRVAEELGEKLGETVGYQVRFEESSSARTRIRFVTEGVLTRRLLSDPMLPGVAAVLLDEFHERHLHGDVALALLRRLQTTARPDLRLVVMSATLDAAPVTSFLSDAPVMRSEGRRFDVAITYAARPDERPLSAQVASAVHALVADGLDGDVLVFLPGAGEIRRAGEACASLAARANLLVLPLHGELPPAEQDRAVRPASQRKVILSTNVAETSVTIDGVVAVIDSGLARMASHAPWSGLPVLKVARVSRASATQRAGRAGRTRAGACVRLYTRHDYDTRQAYDAPEIERLDLAETVLELAASGVADVRTFGWFQAPPDGSVAAAETLLERLGALDASGHVTALGRRMLRFPVHPRQARMILEAEARGVAVDGCVLAALVGERDVRAHNAPRVHGRGRSDLLDTLELFDECDLEGFRVDRVRALGLEPSAVMAVDRVRTQLVRATDRRTAPPATPALRETALLQCILAGYPDRVGRRREPERATGRRGTEIVFATGGTAVLDERSVVRDTELLVAIDAEERIEGRQSQVRVRVASEVQSDWLLELFTDRVRDATHVAWNAAQERAEASRRLTYEGLVLEETRGGAIDRERVADVVAEAAWGKGLQAFLDADELERWRTRVNFLRGHVAELELPVIDETLLRGALREACAMCWSFDDVRRAGVLEAIRARLTAAQTRALDEWAPDRITLPGGRRVRVEYPADGAPWIESRLQDFFGMAEGPTVARGRVPLVLHLLAPNHQAVQVSTDLAGFWTRHYPAVAKELRRQYPRHAWPDDPRHAAPPAPPARRR